MIKLRTHNAVIGLFVGACMFTLAGTAIAAPTCTYDSDYDNDGWGWEDFGAGYESCVMGDSSNDDDDTTSGGTGDPRNDITMLVVTAGQSNAVGSHSRVNNNNGNTEAPLNNVYVWLDYQGKFVRADLAAQNNWNKNDRWTPESKPEQSHAGFHIARTIAAARPNETIGIIPTGTNDRGIDYWYDAGPKAGFYDIRDRVNNAISWLNSGVNKVELFWWMQGESHQFNGVTNDQRYQQSRDAFIQELSENIGTPWFNTNTDFISTTTKNETRINDNIIRALDTDANTYANTCTTRGENKEIVGVTPWGGYDDTHFSGKGLREIGQEVGQKFLDGNCGDNTGSDDDTTGGNYTGCLWYGHTTYPLCTNSNVDWGWENGQSCLRLSYCQSQGQQPVP